MKKNATRIIALALIALMCLALLPMTAFASEPETGAPQVVHESNIVNGQPGRISGLTADMEYANAETDWSWRAAPAGGVLEVAQSCTTYFRYVGVEDEARKSSVTIYDYFTVAASAGTGGSISPAGTQYVLKNGSITFSIAPESGYELDDVTVNGESVGKQESYTFSDVTAAATISASFKQATPPAPTTYTVSFDAKGGTPQPPQQTVTAGQAVSLPTGLSRENYAFAGWSETDGGPAITSQSYTPTQSRTLYARWRELTVYTLHFDANGGGGQMSSLTKTEEQGNSFTVPACTFTPPEGGSFVCWNTDADGNGTNYQPEGTVAIQKAEIPSLTLYAIWSQSGGSGSDDNITVTVTHNRFGRVVYGDSGTTPAGTVTSGTPVTVPKGTGFWLQPNEGAHTKLVKKNNVQVAAASSYSFQDDGTLEITFELPFPASEFETSIGGPSAPVAVGNAQKFTYNISLTLADGSAVPENIVPREPVPFTIPYPSGMSATSHTYTLKHVPDNREISVTADASGIHGSSLNFSAFELLATPRTVSGLSVSIAPKSGTSATFDTELIATVTPSGASVTYQWKRNNVAISGATGSSYKVVAADIGNVISCTVTDTTDANNMKPSNGITPITASSSTKPQPAKPTTPALEKHIIDGKPGVIKGLNSTMEYWGPKTTSWTTCSTTLTVPDGGEGTYYFRYKETETTAPSELASVTVRSYYTVHAWVNRGYGTISPDTSKYAAEMSKGNTDAVSLVEKGGSYKLSIYPARRYYIYTVLDGGEYKGRNNVYTIKKVTAPHLIIVNFAANCSPRTADDSNIPLWTALCCASLAGVGAVWMIWRKRRQE